MRAARSCWSARRGLTRSWSPSAAASTRRRTAGGWRPRGATSRGSSTARRPCRTRSTPCATAATSSTRPPSAPATGAATADFLLRVEEPSELGSFSYEPADAKLATHPKPYFIFQLLFYADMVASHPGARARPRARRARHGRDALVPPARLPGLRRPGAAALPGDAEGLPRRRGAAVPVSRRALRPLRLVDALPRPPPRRRPPVAGRLPHPRAGDPPRGRGRADRDRPRRRSAAGRRSRGSRAPTLAGLRQQAWLQVESRELGPAAVRAAAAGARPRVRPPPAAVARRPVLRHRGRPVLGRARGSSTCSARRPRTARTARCGRTTGRRSGGRSRRGSTG